jgi:hypothetical protein
MLLREIFTVCFETRMEPINTTCGQKVELFNAEHMVNIDTFVTV